MLFYITNVVTSVIKLTHHKSNKVHPVLSSDEDFDGNDDSSQLHVM